MSTDRTSAFRVPFGLVLLAALPGGCARHDQAASAQPAIAPPFVAAAEPPPPPPRPTGNPLPAPADLSLPTRGADGPGTPPPAQPPALVTGDRYALLVGVKTYIPTELKSLKYTENDVTDLAAALKAGGYRPDNVRLLTKAAADTDPSALPLAQNIRSELARLVRDARPGDSVLVALAGHGVQFKNRDESYFCPADARLADQSTLISLNEVCNQLDKCRAGFKLLLVDACRNDPFADVTRSRAEVNLQSLTRPQEKLQPGGTVLLFSCSAGEKAFEDPDLQHGVFFNFVIEGLRGDADLDQDGTVVLPELELFLKKQVKRFVRNKYQSDQRPDLVSRSSRDLVPLVQVKETRVSLSSFVEDASTASGSGTGPADGVFTFSADGRTVVLKMYKEVADLNSASILVWNPGSGKPPAALPNLNWMYAAVSPDGNLLAGSPVDIPALSKIQVYDLAARRVLHTVPSSGIVKGLLFAADGTLLLEQPSTGVIGGIDLGRLDVKTGRRLPVFPQGGAEVSNVVAVSRDGASLARLGQNRQLEVWDVPAGRMRCRSTWPRENEGAPTPTTWSIGSDGKTMVGCCSPFPGKPFLSVWDPAAGRQRCTIALPTGAGVYEDNLGFCPDGKTLIVATAELEGTEMKPWFKFFDLATGKERRTSIQFPAASAVLLSADGTKLLTFATKSAREWFLKVGDMPLAVRKKSAGVDTP
jgi:hypothetical protein